MMASVRKRVVSESDVMYFVFGSHRRVYMNDADKMQ